MDRPSVERLYRAHGGMVLRRARALLGDEQSAEDAVQEVFMKVLSALGRFRGESAPTTWLYQVTTNHCLNLIRNGARRQRANEQRYFSIDGLGGGSAEERIGMEQLLATLPQELGEVAIYHYVDQMHQDEIAALLAISERTVRNRLRQFRDAARALLAVVPKEAVG